MTENRPAIPAEISRQVLVEAGHRCAIPTCRDSANIDLHHIVPWATCKKHEPTNLIALCPSCHRLAHDKTIDRKSLLKYKEICKKLSNPPVKHASTEVKAYIKFNPNALTDILDAGNMSSFADHGIFNYSFNFIEEFEDESYVINAIGDGSISFKVVEKSKRGVQLIFAEPCPNIVRLEFRY